MELNPTSLMVKNNPHAVFQVKYLYGHDDCIHVNLFYSANCVFYILVPMTFLMR